MVSNVADIKSSWAACKPDAVGHTFYVNLSKMAPDAYEVFGFGGEDVNTSGKVKAQAKLVMAFINTAVSNIDNMDKVNSDLAALSQRHTKYGAKRCHFPGAGKALLAALEHHAGGAWNANAAKGWTSFYGIISDGICQCL